MFLSQYLKYRHLRQLLPIIFVYCATNSFSAFASKPSAPPFNMDYTITIKHPSPRVNVEVCFDGNPPAALENGSRRKAKHFMRAYVSKRRLRVTNKNRTISLRGVKPDSCIQYSAKATLRRSERHQRGKIDKLYDVHSWLWQPVGIRRVDNVRIHFNLPEGIHVSTPWPRLEGTTHSFKLTNTPPDWTSRIAIGAFEPVPVSVGQQTMQVAILNTDDKKRRKEYLNWIKEAGDAITGMYGRFPVNNAQIIIFPIGEQYEAIPWAEVQRGGSSAAHYFVDSSRPIKEFHDDWTGVHELSHLFIPYIQRGQLWISEGIATYYQNVVRGSSGMLTPEQAWNNILEGFRNKKDDVGTDELVVSDVTEQIYWGGAAFFLMVDVELRKRTQGQMTLAKTLDRLQACCFVSGHRVEDITFMELMDKLSKTKVFTDLYYREGYHQGFPRVGAVLEDIGFVQPLSRDWVSVDSLNDIGRSIMERDRPSKEPVELAD